MSLIPDIPMVPGVPALLRGAAPLLNALGNISHISNVLSGLLLGPVDETWGVYDLAGNEILQADTIVAIDYRNGSRLVDYPLEAGAFETYNKVANPFDVVVTAAAGGSEGNRHAFMATLKTLQASLDRYVVVVPEGAYYGVNMERFDYRRENRNGSHLIVANLYFREVRITATVNGQAPQKPDAFAIKGTGQVSASPLSNLQSKLMSGAAGALASVQAQAGLVVGATQAAVKTATTTLGSMGIVR